MQSYREEIVRLQAAVAELKKSVKETRELFRFMARWVIGIVSAYVFFMTLLILLN